MDKDMVQAYTLRVTQANRSELIVIMYELILNDLKKASSLEVKDEEYHKTLFHATKCINELICVLDFQFELSYQLMRLYKYVNECIAKLKIKKNEEITNSAIDTIEGLRVAFEQVADKDTSGPVMRNTEQVYAGLTYSRGTLNESLLANSDSRGFQA